MYGMRLQESHQHLVSSGAFDLLGLRTTYCQAITACGHGFMSTGGVIGLTMVPLVADALGGEAAFLLSGAVGIAWALFGAAIMHRIHTTAAGKTAAGADTHKQRLPEHLQAVLESSQDASGVQKQPELSWRLDAGSWRQVAMLCYAHAVIGLGFFLMQVGIRAKGN